MKIAVVGTGYVGLVSGTCFAETGTIVTCVDVNEKKISQLNSGIIPIYEPGLENMVKRNVEKQRLFFTTNLKDAMVGAEAIFIAVGTPPDEDGSADLKHVLTVASEIGRNLQVYTVVVNKSTVPVGTAQKVKNVIKQELEKRGVNIPFDVASNPEFLKEGNAIDDFLKPDRSVAVRHWADFARWYRHRGGTSAWWMTPKSCPEHRWSRRSSRRDRGILPPWMP